MTHEPNHMQPDVQGGEQAPAEAPAEIEREACIQVEGLWKIFGDQAQAVLTSPDLTTATRDQIMQDTGCTVAVRDVSFTVERGEVFVIMGLSGSGKSTLIRLLLRLIEPSRGRVLVNGDDVCAYGEEKLLSLRRGVMAMVFQHYGLLPHRTVLDNVAHGLKIRGVAQAERYARAREVIERVGLAGWEQHYPAALSGGMQQRVGLARALANDPEILLMDEPFSGLDPLIRRQMQDELIVLQEDFQKTIVFVTHDLNEAVKVGDRIAIMRDGEIIQTGTPEEVVTSPSDDYVEQFVRDASPAQVLTAGSIMEDSKALIYNWQGPKVALHLMRSQRLESAFVVSSTRKLEGMVDLRHLIKGVRGGATSLHAVMDTDVVPTQPDVAIADLIAQAADSERPIPVVDDGGRLVGEVHRAAILASMVRTAEETA